MNPTPCKVCTHEKADEINDLLRKEVPQAEISKSFGISQSAVSRHKVNHLGGVVAPPEIDPKELDTMPSPDVVKLIEREVNRFTLLERQRQLDPLETREKARYTEFLIRITIERLQAKEKKLVDQDWLDNMMAKVKAGEYTDKKD